MVRLDPSLHEKLASYASGRELSLNQACVYFLKQGLVHSRNISAEEKEFRKASAILKRHFGSSLLGVVLFGSRVQGGATDQSDWDLLIVLGEDIPIRRSLYSWWDALRLRSGQASIKIDFKSGPVNPHFVHLPQEATSAGGLWLEVALHHKIIYEKGRKLSGELQKIFQAIQKGEVIRHFSNGHPYWVRRQDAQS